MSVTLRFGLVGLLALAGCASLTPRPTAPVVAHHQHLISPAFAEVLKQDETYTAKDLLAHMDVAGARQGVVLSMGYTFADERKRLSDPAARTAAENDWTSAQVMQAPRRLLGVCSVNPLLDGADAELARCLRLPGMHGLKLHFGNSGVDVLKPDHLQRVRTVFAVADRGCAPIIVHLRARSGTPYGKAQTQAFLAELLPAAPRVTVQVAHLAGSGPGFDPAADEALGVLAQAVEDRDARVRHLLFDLTTVARADALATERDLLARRIRQVGTGRVLFGTDLPIGGNPALEEAWTLFRTVAPLTEAEFADLADNVAPYLHGQACLR